MKAKDDYLLGMHAGLTQTDDEYVLLMNPDGIPDLDSDIEIMQSFLYVF